MKKFIEIIKTSSDKAEIEKAKKGIHGFWHGITNMKPSDNKKFEVFLDELKTFDEIKTEENKIHFIQSLIWPMMALSNTYVKEFGEFILKYIQSPSGKIRKAILSSSDHLSTPLALNDLILRKENPTEKEIEEMNRYNRQFFEIVEEAEKLLEKYDTGEFDKYDYVSDMPPSVYKSIQYLITEKLMRVVETEVMYQEYLRQKKNINKPVDIVEAAETIIARRQLAEKREEIEDEICELLYQAKSDFELEDVRRVIYEEEETDDMQKVISMFDTGEKGAPQLDTILETVTDAWNHFPHRVLDGLSPAEISLEHKNR